MTLKPRADLPAPPLFYEGMSDRERRIDGGPVYPLVEVKEFTAALQTQALAAFTKNATHDINFTLQWQLQDVCNFIACLDRRHYQGSQWCFGSQAAKRPFPSDVYIMGFNRFSKQEIQQLDPKSYFKFSFSAAINKIAIFSLHPETK